MQNMLQLGPQGPEKHFFRDRAAKTWPKGKQTEALKERKKKVIFATKNTFADYKNP